MRYLSIIAIAVLFSCSSPKQEVDFILYNASIYTVDSDFSTAEAFVVDKGVFKATGTKKELLEAYTPKTTIDAGGKTIIPGIIDAHCHFYGLGLNQLQADLVGTKSFEEVLEKVQSFHALRPSEFILGRGWDQNDWEIKEFPTKQKLDLLFPDVPVALERVDGHAYLVNQKALDMAGIDKNTPETGGAIIKKNGALTGVLVDAPMGRIYDIMPTMNRATQIEALKVAEKICFQNGLTTVNDAGLDKSVIDLIDSLQNSGDLKIRVYAMVSNSPSNLDYYLNSGILKTDRLHVRSVKVYADGALGSRGATLKAPYSDHDGHFGAMITPAEEIENLALRIAASDYQMNTHAIGDSANAVVLKAYKKALDGKTDRRWKVEHAQVIAPEDFDFFANGIIPSVQPTHATSDMYWAEDRLGEERVLGAYAFKKLLNSAGILPLGTDFPVEKVSPFLTFYAAVARQDTEQYPEDGFQIQDALSRVEALRGMTIWAAYSNFEEDEKGSIEGGKKADFVILSEDLMTTPIENVLNMKAEAVYINGVKTN